MLPPFGLHVRAVFGNTAMPYLVDVGTLTDTAIII
jgi:hypothetical protein